MTVEPVLRVALIGYSFMGRAHARGWRTVSESFSPEVDAEVVVVVGRDINAAEAFALRHGIPEVRSDWREVVSRGDVDIVDICTPGDSHAEIAIEALRNGKHVLCEKPLANSAAEAAAMASAAREAAGRGVVSMVGFSYRRMPAVTLAKELIDAGRIGQIHHVRAMYLQDWILDPAFPLVWRLQKERAGSGALGDLGSHIVDLVQYLAGQEIVDVSALTETFVRQRPLAASATGLSARSTKEGQLGEVTVDDAFIAIARTEHGALATLEATRFAAGRKNALRVEVNGSAGSVAYDYEHPNHLELYEVDSSNPGFARIDVTEPHHPYLSGWWPEGHPLGYDAAFAHQAHDLLNAIAGGDSVSPSFEEALQVQRVLEAIETSSQNAASWIHPCKE